MRTLFWKGQMVYVGHLVHTGPVDQLQALAPVDDPVDVDGAPGHRPGGQLVVLGHSHQAEGAAGVHRGELAERDGQGGVVLVEVDQLDGVPADGVHQSDTGGPHTAPGLWGPEHGLREVLREEGLSHLVGQLLLILSGRLLHLLCHLDLPLGVIGERREVEPVAVVVGDPGPAGHGQHRLSSLHRHPEVLHRPGPDVSGPGVAEVPW